MGSEERLGNNTTDMSGISMMADKADRVRKDLERETMAREDQIEQLENKLKEAKYLAVDAERKYEEVARKMNMMENDLEKAHQREDILKDQIRHLVSRLKDAESRAEYGEMNVQKQKCKAINDELQQTFNDMVQNY